MRNLFTISISNRGNGEKFVLMQVRNYKGGKLVGLSVIHDIELKIHNNNVENVRKVRENLYQNMESNVIY